MKIAFISDIHSNLHAFEQVLGYIEELSVDEIWCCGDIVGYNAFPRECLKIVIDDNIQSVMGNHDWATTTGDTSWFNVYGVAGVDHGRRYLTEDDMLFLQSLPENKLFERDGVSFYIAHGSPRDNVFEYVFPWSSDFIFDTFAQMVGSEVIVLGHTHISMERKVGDKIFLNPGSVGQPRDGIPKASFMVFDTKDISYRWYRVAYDIDAAAKSIRGKGLPGFLADRLYLGQ